MSVDFEEVTPLVTRGFIAYISTASVDSNNHESEHNLAIAVIAQTIKDFRESNYTCSECEDFLLGKTEISLFWFEASGFEPLQPFNIQRFRGSL